VDAVFAPLAAVGLRRFGLGRPFALVGPARFTLGVPPAAVGLRRFGLGWPLAIPGPARFTLGAPLVAVGRAAFGLGRPPLDATGAVAILGTGLAAEGFVGGGGGGSSWKDVPVSVGAAVPAAPGAMLNAVGLLPAVVGCCGLAAIGAFAVVTCGVPAVMAGDAAIGRALGPPLPRARAGVMLNA
jgi:hypothetical protein